MILSASRRTDIPAYYDEWFFNRLREKLVIVRNPMNIHQVSALVPMYVKKERLQVKKYRNKSFLSEKNERDFGSLP